MKYFNWLKGDEVQNIQGQTILIQSPSSVRQAHRDNDQGLTPVRQVRQNNFIRIDKSQLSSGSTVQFVKNGQLHSTSGSADRTPGGGQGHHVTRRILPQAQLAAQSQNQNQTPTRVVHQSNHPNHHHRQQTTPQRTPQQQQQQSSPLTASGNKTLRLVTVDRTTGRKQISGVQVAKIKLPSQQSPVQHRFQQQTQQQNQPQQQQQTQQQHSNSIPRQSHARIIHQNSPSPRPPQGAPTARVSGTRG